MTKKRRTVPREQRAMMVKTASGATITCSGSKGYVFDARKTVRMRAREVKPGSGWWDWRVFCGNRELYAKSIFKSERSARRSGNAWAKHMGLTPEWER